MDEALDDLSLATLEIVRALALSSDVSRPAAIDEQLLSQFAVGLVSEEERELVVHALTLSDEMRQRLIVLRREMMVAGSPTRKPVLAKALRAYRAIQDRVDLADPAIRGALREVGRRVAAGLPGPKWATVRSRTEHALETWAASVLPDGQAATLTAHLTKDGSLIVTASMTEPVPSLVLLLRDPAFGGIAFGRAFQTEGAYRFEVPGFVGLTGIDRVTASVLLLHAAGAGAIDDLGAIPVALPNRDSVSVRLRSAPEIADGLLRLVCSLPEGSRASLTDYDLVLSVVVGSLELPLSALPVGELHSDDVLFEAEVGDVPDGVIGCGSVFRLSFLLRS
jgi:hypothetical protein